MSCVQLSYDLVYDSFFRQIKGSDDINRDSLSSIINDVRTKSINDNLSPDDINTIKNALIEAAEEFDVLLDEVDDIDLNALITSAWESSKREDTSNLVKADEPVILEDEIPLIKDGLFKVFRSVADQEFFLKRSRAALINSVFIDPDNRVLVDTNRSLNESFRSLKNEMGRQLAYYLGVPAQDLYVNKVFNENAYKAIISAAQARFSGHTEGGLFEGTSRTEKQMFEKYLLLTNFDDFLENHFDHLIEIAPLYHGSMVTPKNIEKYTMNLGKHIKQDFSDSETKDDASTHTNGAVQMFVNSIPKINAKGEIIPNEYVMFREFNSLIRVIRESGIKSRLNVRDYPSIAIKDVMDQIYKNIPKYFQNEDTILADSFRSIYRAIFDQSNPNSLFSLNTINSKLLKNDIFTMLINHMNKMSPITYVQSLWDNEEGKYDVKVLDSEYLSEKKANLEKHLTLQSINLSYDKINSKYNVVFEKSVKDGKEKIIGVQFTIGSDTHNISYSGGNTTEPVMKEVVKKFTNPEYAEFFKDVFMYNINEAFMDNLVSVNDFKSAYRLLNLASNVLLNAELAKEYNKEASNKVYIANKLGPGILSTNDRQWYDNRLRSLRIAGFNSGLGGLIALSKSVSAFNRDTTRSNVHNASGAGLSKFRLTNLVNDDLYLFNKLFNGVLEDKTRDIANPMAYNLFTAENANASLIKGTQLLTDYTNSDGSVKSISDMNDKELLYNQFLFFYLGQKKNNIVQVQPTVYADKSNIWTKVIDTNKKFTYRDIYGNVVVDNKSISDLNTDELERLYFASMHSMYTLLKDQIKSDYDKVFGELHKLYPSKKFNPNDSFEGYTEQLERVNKDMIYNAIYALQSRGEQISFLPEVHYVWHKKKKKFVFNNVLKANFDIFSTKGNDTTRENMSDAFFKKVQLEDMLFAYNIDSSGVSFDTKLSDGSENKIITDNIDFSIDQVDFWDSLSEASKARFKDMSYGSIWRDIKTESLVPYYVLDESGNIIDEPGDLLTLSEKNPNNYKVVLNPELRRYKTIDNLISNNYNSATAGLAFLHPTKKWGGLVEEESSRTTSMYKRGVIFGATGHPFIKNLRTGIPNKYRLSVINDLEAANFGLKGPNENATQYDGSIWLSPLMAIWEQNSLSELKLSPVHRKPIGYYSLGQYMSSGLLKCATFTVTNEMVRNSTDGKVNGRNLIRNMLGKKWLIPNLDITNGGKITYSGSVYLNTNTFKYYKIASIKKLPISVVGSEINNPYEINIKEIDKYGNELSGIQTTVKSINSNYDLWDALGGENSGKMVKGEFELSEDSVMKVAEVASQISLYKDAKEYKELSDLGITTKVPKTYYLKDPYTRVEYFQPMKYSNIDYLANASAVKNGMGNVNPDFLYTTKPAGTINLSTDRVIYGHPAIGKTFAMRQGANIISFDDDFRDQINKFINEHKEEGETKRDYKKRHPEEYEQFLYDLFKQAQQSKIPIFFSDVALLNAMLNNEEPINKIITMSEEEFVKRDIERGGNNEADARDWKHTIDGLIEEAVDVYGITPIDATNNHLSDLINPSRLIYTEIDPDFLIIQLNTEHEIEDSLVSEMTQVISALEQMGTTHDLANQVFEDIGKVIYEGIQEYRKFDLETEEGQSALYNLLGKSLIKVFNSGQKDNISLASAYLQYLQEGVLQNKLLSEQKFRIPFDDNNIFSAFVTNFSNGLNKDLIKRKFPGLTAVLNPSQDIFTLYDGPDGNQLIYKDFLRKAGSKEEYEAMRSALDVEVQVGAIRTGDYIELDGKTYLVNTYNDAGENEISLQQVKDLRRQGILTIKKLGSKGHNLRAQNIEFDITGTNLGEELVHFDQYDLDSARLSHSAEELVNLHRKEKSLTPEEKARYDELMALLQEANKSMKEVYPDKDLNNMLNDKAKLLSYIEVAIKNDLELLQQGKFRVPLAYRGSQEIVDVLNYKYTANQIALGKPWAEKFLLEKGDSVQDILSQGANFFIDRLASRRNSRMKSDYYDLYFTGNSTNLHFTNDEDLIKKLRRDGKAKKVEISTVIRDNKMFRQLPGDVFYEISPNMRFYNVTNEDGSTSELVIGASDTDILNIWGSKVFYNRTFNYNESNLERLVKLHNSFPKERNQIKYSKDLIPATLMGKEKEMILAREIEQAKRMFTSFQEASNYIVARIPAQSMQSFMNMTIAGFIDAETNIAYVPVEQLIFQGSDYDIDKAYILGAGVSDTGVYYDWSPYFDYSSKENFDLSKELPFPTGREYTIQKGVEGLDVSEFNNYFANAFANGDKYDLNILKQLLDKVYNSGTTSLASNTNRMVLDVINEHNTYRFSKSDALKNRIFNLIWKTGADPRNFIEETTPITMDAAREGADASTNGQFSKAVSNDNPGAKVVLQVQNSVGKTSIAVYANGIKVFSTLLNYYHNGLKQVNDAEALYNQKIAEFRQLTGVSEDVSDEKILERLSEYVIANPNNAVAIELFNSLSETIALKNEVEKYLLNPKGYIVNGKSVGNEGFQVYNDKGEEFLIKQTLSLPNINFKQLGGLTSQQLIDLKTAVTKAGFKEDVFGTLSVLLSSATDNAKELILEKINASGRMASVYIYLLTTGVDFKTALDFMTSKLVSMVQKKSQVSVVSEEDKYASVDSAIKYYKDGVSLKSYIDPKYNISLFQVLSKFASQIRLPMTSSSNLEKAVNTLSETKEGRAKIREIMKLIGDNSSDFNLVEIERKNVDPDSEQVELDEADMGGGSIPKNKRRIGVAYLFNRYLADVIKRAEQLEGMNKAQVQHNLDVLTRLKEGAEEISRLASLCGINQGIKTSMLDIFNFINGINKFVNKRIKIEGEKFDFREFLKNDEYKQRWIDYYEEFKTTFNILDIISKTPHFAAMYQVMSLNQDIMNLETVKFGMFNRFAQNLVDKGILNSLESRDASTINRYIDDIILHKFFSSYYNRSVQLDTNDEIYTAAGDTTSEDGILTLNDVYGRASFKRWFETKAIPELKSKYSDNSFIQGLLMNYFNNNFGIYSLYQLPLNLNSLDTEDNQVTYANYLKDFTAIKDDMYNNMTIEDLFFTYNLLVNKNQFGAHSLTKIFENSLVDADQNGDNDSVIFDFLKFESELKDTDIDFDIRDLYIRFLNDNNKSFTKVYDRGRDTSEIRDSNGRVVEMFLNDTNIILPYQDETAQSFDYNRALLDRVVNLILEGKAQVKLKCDD